MWLSKLNYLDTYYEPRQANAALPAGLLFAFSAFVMDALARLPPEQGIAAIVWGSEK